MTVFGCNLTIAGKEVGMKIERLKTYRVTNELPATLYEITDARILNLSADFLRSYNAWLVVPGEWRGYYDKEKVVTLKAEKVAVPNIPGKKSNQLKWLDAFTFATNFVKERAIYDVVYTMARMNEMTLCQFLEKCGVEW